MITFYSDVRKEDLPYKQVSKDIRRFIRENQPELELEFLAIWERQFNKLSLKDIQRLIEYEMLEAGSGIYWFESEYLEVIRNTYTNFVEENIAPAYQKAAQRTVETIDTRLGGFTASVQYVKQWAAEHAAENVKRLTDQQRAAMNALIQRAVETSTGLTPMVLARSIRPLIGLTKQQALANLRYNTGIRENLLKNHPRMKPEIAAEKAQTAALKYAKRQIKYRASTIARNELAMAYKQGEGLSISHAQNAGLLGRCNRRWATVHDDRTCDICKAMDGVTASDGEPFRLPGGEFVETTHAHVCCRCACEWIEIEPGRGLGYEE